MVLTGKPRARAWACSPNSPQLAIPKSGLVHGARASLWVGPGLVYLIRTIASFIPISQPDEVPKKQRLKKNHGQANALRLAAAQSSDKDGLEADRLARCRIKGRRLTGKNRSPGSEMGHRTHSIARVKPHLKILGAGWRRGHICGCTAQCDGFFKYFHHCGAGYLTRRLA